MGVLNLTPDSFSDGGLPADPGNLRGRVESLLTAGADLIDVGAESTRPGATAVSDAEQLRRLEAFWPLLAQVPVPVSIDTRSGVVARAALAAGVEIVNDVSAGNDPDLLAAVAEAGALLILMHSRGTPADMDNLADYGDLQAEVAAEWLAARARAVAAGVDAAHIWFDPGLGFAKTAGQCWTLLRGIETLRPDGAVCMVGASRKRFLAMADEPAAARDTATAVLSAWLAARGVDVVRVHDVAANRRALATFDRLETLPELAA